MEELIEQCIIAPGSLSDAELSTVFFSLIESPLENFTCADLLEEMHNRESATSYEIARAIALYYSDLDREFFTFDRGSGFLEPYARGLNYICKAYKLRDDSYNSRFKKPDEFSDSQLENALVFRFGMLLNRTIYDIETKSYRMGAGQRQIERIVEFIRLAEVEIYDTKSPSELLPIVKKHCEPYLTFVEEYIESIPEHEERDSSENVAEDDDDSDELNFEVYTLNNINLLNEEIHDNIEFIQKPSLRKILNILLFDRKKLQQIGLIMSKIDLMISDTNFEGIQLASPEQTVNQVEKFRIQRKRHLKRLQKNQGMYTLFYISLAGILYAFQDWYILPAILLMLAISHAIKIYGEQQKIKQLEHWYSQALFYIKTQSPARTIDNSADYPSRSQTRSDAYKHPMKYLLKYEQYEVKEKNTEWSVRCFDRVSEIIKRCIKKINRS